MAKSVEIPQDIIDSVIAAVGDDTRVLKQCTLVSSSFFLPSRKQLFSRITLRSDKTCHGIHQFLVQNPVIQSFVRTITLEQMSLSDPKISEWMNGTSLLAILRLPFGCLESFSVTVHLLSNECDWNYFSSELKDSLSNIIHSSTLKTLSLTGISKLPTTLFLRIVHLSTLELHYIDFCDEDSTFSHSSYSSSESLTRAASMEVTPVASHTAIDRCVWHFAVGIAGTRFPSSAYFSLIQDREDLNKSKFLPFMCRLRFFEIYANLVSGTINNFNILSILMGSLCISLTSPATLEHLKLNISFDEFNSLSAFYENLHDADVWRYLDSITSRPTGSRLQRVDIYINSYICFDNEGKPDDDEVWKTILDSLPLLCSKGILFVEVKLR
jgi:hypothetical protein